MYFGDLSAFAVELDIERVFVDDRGERWPEGRVRYWCQRHAFGDGATRSLRAYMLGLPDEIAYRKRRYDESMFALPPEELIVTVVDAVYGGEEERSAAEIRVATQRYFRFLMTPDVLDGFRVVAVEGSEGCRVVCADIELRSIRSAVLRGGVLESVLQDVVEELGRAN